MIIQNIQFMWEDFDFGVSEKPDIYDAASWSQLMVI